jgi:four helix bundle protein
VKAAVSGESRDVFMNEFGKARRKASETEYWRQLIHYAGLISGKEFDPVEEDRVEVIKFVNAILRSSRANV